MLFVGGGAVLFGRAAITQRRRRKARTRGNCIFARGKYRTGESVLILGKKTREINVEFPRESIVLVEIRWRSKQSSEAEPRNFASSHTRLSSLIYPNVDAKSVLKQYLA